MTAARATLELTLLEAAHLSDLVGQFEEVVAGRDSGDPALRRLLPDAYRDDDAAAAEFRRLTQDDLLERRLTDAGVVRASLRRNGRDLDPAELDRAQAEDALVVELTAEVAGAWLRTLAALRLVLAERLGVTEEDQGEEDDPRFGVYEWVGYRLDMLVRVLDG
ncbi:DUF2017 family protein [Microbacterium oleivorans]|uniref:DUF2017 family protein n=1 Tax=Microbacterium oleivorans TaxID=273677 RepID=UPI00203AA3E6|nr:DUF2017 family protein [Microbacterium oleivorans]MCM3696783.1 DUF2017 domain-containing protein [Microbacterium oleivorans]